MNAKQAQRRTIALMTSGFPITICPPGPRYQEDQPVAQLPVDNFAEGYLASILGDQAVVPVLDEDGNFIAEETIARKRGQEWRDEIELQESGEIVGYWGEGL